MNASEVKSLPELTPATAAVVHSGYPILSPVTAGTTEAGGPAASDRTNNGQSENQPGASTDSGLQGNQKELAGLRNYYVGFEKDEKTGATVIKVIDRDSGEILRQIPPDQVLAMMSRLNEMQSLMFDRKA